MTPFSLLFLKASHNVNRSPNVIKSRTKTIILLLAEKGTLRQMALAASGVPVGISSVSCRKRDKDFPVSGTLWPLPRHGYMLALETGTLSTTFPFLLGNWSSGLFCFLTPPSGDLWCFLYWPMRQPCQEWQRLPEREVWMSLVSPWTNLQLYSLVN